MLIVEDDAVTAKAYELLLTSCQCEVRHASQFKEAMALCRGGWPQAIILDIQLPLEDITGIGTWNGFDFLTWLRAMTPNPPPVFVISSQNGPVSREQAITAGAAGFFPKPVTKQVLLNAVFRAVGQTRPLLPSEVDAQLKPRPSSELVLKGEHEADSRVKTWWKGLFGKKAA